MKALLLGGAASRNSGGIYFTTQALATKLKEKNVNIELLLSKDGFTAEDIYNYGNLALNLYEVTGPSNFGYSRELLNKMKQINPDIVHTQALWLYLSYVNKKYSRNKPYIIQPHGMLDYWQLNQSLAKDLKKKMALFLYENEHLKQATCIQALCYEEYKSIRNFGLKNNIAIIPNGVHLPLVNNVYKKDNSTKNLLFLSRVHPKKGLQNLLTAWSKINHKSYNWNLIIAGSGEHKYYNSLIELSKKLKINDKVQFVGAQFGQDKHTIFENADAFILPSYSEGLPMAILEAWSYKLPALITSQCNLQIGFEKNAAIEIFADPDDISRKICKLFEMNEMGLAQMGMNGYELVKNNFTWDKVAESTIKMYNWAVGKAEKPDFIYEKL